MVQSIYTNNIYQRVTLFVSPILLLTSLLNGQFSCPFTATSLIAHVLVSAISVQWHLLSSYYVFQLGCF